jgi:rubredoxin
MVYSYFICPICGNKALNEIYTDELEFSVFDIQNNYMCPECEADFQIEINVKRT